MYKRQAFHSTIVSAFGLLALAFLLSDHVSQVLRVYVIVHGLWFCVRGVLVLLLYPAYECVARFVLSNGMDVNSLHVTIKTNLLAELKL